MPSGNVLDIGRCADESRLHLVDNILDVEMSRSLFQDRKAHDGPGVLVPMQHVRPIDQHVDNLFRFHSCLCYEPEIPRRWAPGRESPDRFSRSKYGETDLDKLIDYLDMEIEIFTNRQQKTAP